MKKSTLMEYSLWQITVPNLDVFCHSMKLECREIFAIVSSDNDNDFFPSKKALYDYFQTDGNGDQQTSCDLFRQC